MVTEHQVRERAYYIWEDEGRVAGRAEIHWLRAEAELQAVARPLVVEAVVAHGSAAPSPAKALAKAPAKALKPAAIRAKAPKAAAPESAKASPKSAAKAKRAPRAAEGIALH